ncbi:MAG: hypothetical protein ACR2MG_12725 [Pyrinomonadaceae bacterium]
MKKRILLAIAVLLVFGLTIAAFAYNKTNTTNQAAMDCCKKNDSCPLKNKSSDAAVKEDCCLKDDSCPMKDKQAQDSSVDMKNVTVVSGESCCHPGADCCNGGACCKNKKS